jgi:Tol biopolymer transport system component
MGQIVIQDSSGKNIKAVTPAVKSQSMVPTWSPDGSLLAINVTGDKCGIWKAGIENNDWEKMSVQGGGSVISWSPDGRNIVFNDLKNKMYVLRYDVGSRESKLIVVQHTETLSQDFDISWSPDGSRLLYEVKNLENNKNELWIAKLPKLVSDY